MLPTAQTAAAEDAIEAALNELRLATATRARIAEALSGKIHDGELFTARMRQEFARLNGYTDRAEAILSGYFAREAEDALFVEGVA